MTPLERLAAAFVDDLSDLLNKTVAKGIRISSVASEPGLVIAGRNVTKQQLMPDRVPIRTDNKKAACYLDVMYTLEMDSGDYLTVTKSKVGVYADPDGRRALVHYDYNKDPDHEYPDPHVQVEGKCPVLDEIYERAPGETRLLRDIHFPVGSRRFRPTLEDVIRMLVAEELVAPHKGWASVVDRHELRWKERQASAVARRFPQIAAATLETIGYTVSPPPDEEPPSAPRRRSRRR